MRGLPAIIALLTTLGCSGPAAQPTGKAMNLDEAAARLSKLSGQPVRPFATRDFGREENAAARSVLIDEDDPLAIVDQIRAELGPGLLALIGCTRSLADPPAIGSEVVVAHGDSQFDILRVAQSDAVNYGMETEDLVRKLQEYDSTYGIDIFHAETDTIEFRFHSVPSNLTAFCEDLYEFCPDIVDQGTETVDELEKEIAKTGTVFLWWD